MGFMNRKTTQKKKQPGFPDISPVPSHEVFTPRRLIIFFVLLEIGIVALLYPTFIGRWHMFQAKEMVQKGKLEAAYKHYQWLGKHTEAPKSATYQLELGNVCMGLKLYQEAIEHLQLTVEKTEGQKGSYSLLGQAYMIAGNLKEARKCFLKELEKNPTDSPSNFNLGKMSYDEKKYSESTAYFSRVAYIPGYQNLLKPYWQTIEKEVLLQK